MKMVVDKEPSSQQPSQVPGVAHIDFTMDEGTVMRSVKAWASWATPRKSIGSQRESKTSEKLSHSQPTEVRNDYEGDLLTHFVRLCAFLASFS